MNIDKSSKRDAFFKINRSNEPFFEVECYSELKENNSRKRLTSSILRSGPKKQSVAAQGILVRASNVKSASVVLTL